MCLWQVSLAVRVQELIGCMFLTFDGVPGSNVAESLDGAYLGLSAQKLQGLNNNVTMLIILTNSQFLQYKVLNSGQRC